MNLKELTTEQRNPRTLHIDELPTPEIARLINEEDQGVPRAVHAILPDIARAIDLIAARLAAGGRLFYIGAGTSGRLGILDAVECPPTYRTDPDLIQGIIAGGTPAIFRAQEGAEDSEDAGRDDLKTHGFTEKDVACGIAASGRTPYVCGALRYARELGGACLALACTPHAAIAALADIALLPITGPEVITGSTRMKAGTAQKLVLNMLSTGAMIRLGKTYGNLMVDLHASNAKLMERATDIVMTIADCSRAAALAALREADGSAKLAALRAATGAPLSACQTWLIEANGRLKDALQRAGKEHSHA